MKQTLKSFLFYFVKTFKDITKNSSILTTMVLSIFFYSFFYPTAYKAQHAQALPIIIVDEEHEQTFKQMDPAPRFHARDAAIVLANFHKAKVLLGSATPSLETYYNAQSAKYGLVTLKERFGKVQMPVLNW